MLEVLKFIFESISKFLAMLFTIDIGHNMSLGLLMCIVFIFLPLVLILVSFLKSDLLNELDERYDLFSREDKYIGKHEYVGKHSKEYFKRRR